MEKRKRKGEGRRKRIEIARSRKEKEERLETMDNESRGDARGRRRNVLGSSPGDANYTPRASRAARFHCMLINSSRRVKSPGSEKAGREAGAKRLEEEKEGKKKEKKEFMEREAFPLSLSFSLSISLLLFFPRYKANGAAVYDL